MRMNKRTDYAEISRRSIQRDFQRPAYRQYVGKHDTVSEKHEQNEPPKENAERRIIFVCEQSSYYKYRSYIVGKLVRLVEQAQSGGWFCEFVHDEDRQALNKAAGWSEKQQYLFDCVKYKD